jgi:DNA-binding SARP family transcriptional activator
MTGESRVWVSLLGPLECRVGGRLVTVRSRKQRSILAVLAFSAPEIVSRDRLIEALWDDAIPPSARNTLEAYVSRLRRAFGENGLDEQVIRTRDPGYVLRSETDVGQFEARRASAAAKAAGGETQAAADELTAALTLWRGAALADLLDEPFAALESPRLEELRLVAREELARLRLDLGDHGWAIPELELLIAVQPLREGPRRLLMLALYRAGRQAEALALYRETRVLLRRELGLEPSPELRELEQAILRHDESLRLPADGDRSSTAAPVRRIAANRRRCGFGFGGVWIVGHHDGTLKETTRARTGSSRSTGSPGFRHSNRSRRSDRSGFLRPAATSCASTR